MQTVGDRVVLARVHVDTRHAAKVGGAQRDGFSAVGFEQLLAEALQSAQSAYNMLSALMVAGLTVWAAAPVPVHAVFPSNRYLTPKVRAFIDLAVARFPGQMAQARNLVGGV